MFLPRIQHVKKTFERLEHQTKKFGLEVNESKIKFMTASKTLRSVNRTETFGTFSFEVVNEFVYLESILTGNNDLRKEVGNRFKSANRAYYALLLVMKCQNGSEQLKSTYINLN